MTRMDRKSPAFLLFVVVVWLFLGPEASSAQTVRVAIGAASVATLALLEEIESSSQRERRKN